MILGMVERIFWWVLVSGLVGLGWMLLCHYFPFFQKMAKPPSGSMGWPVVGESLAFLKPHYSFSKGSFLDEHCARYGNVFKSHLFGSPAVVSCDPELNSYVLQNENTLFECSYPEAMHGILGKSSMLVAVGESHKRLRSQALNFINAVKSNHEVLDDIETNALLVMDSWKDKKTIMFCEEAKKFTFNVIVKQILGLAPENPLTGRILEDFHAFMKGFVSMPVYIPGTPYRRAMKARQRILCSLNTIMEERSRQGPEDKATEDSFDVLLANNSFTKEEKLTLIMDLLLGGYETTSTLLSLVIHFVAGSQSALQELKDEHETIQRTKPKNKNLSWQDYKQMIFTQNVIKEALRFGNVVKFVHRKAIKDVKFRDFEIPAGWKVLPVFTGVHLDQSIYKDPVDFNPWRWKMNCPSRKEFMPFGGGPRLCPGSELAKVEIAFFIHHLVLNFRWKIKEPDHPLAHPYVEFDEGLPILVERLHGVHQMEGTMVIPEECK